LLPSVDLPAPPDPLSLTPLVQTWASGKPIVRCHSSAFGASEFNPSGTEGRFRPFDVNGQVVPTLYGADATAGAVSETVFHNIPVAASAKYVRSSALVPMLVSTVAPDRELRLVRLHGHGFHRLGVTRARLIEGDADTYPRTAEWAAALHATEVLPDGLIWRSRQFDDSYAVILFGDRVQRNELVVIQPPIPLAWGPGREELERLALDAGITLTE
jgi:hypothetical protein